jgi:hypothetical protein
MNAAPEVWWDNSDMASLKQFAAASRDPSGPDRAIAMVIFRLKPAGLITLSVASPE